MVGPSTPLPDDFVDGSRGRVHFSGIGGAGVSALAQFLVEGGGVASGSDRFFDRGEMADEVSRLRRAGIEVGPQDGAMIEGAACVVASAAVETQVPEMVRAAALGTPVFRRAEWLAALVRRHPTVAVGGTSGKSTVAAMVFEALEAAGADPGIITGGDLIALRGPTRRGNARNGMGPLVIEADESDKSLVLYEPAVGIVLNLHRDHDDVAKVLPAFATFHSNCRRSFVVGEDAELASLRPAEAVVGFGPQADFRAEDLRLAPDSTSFRVGDLEVRLPLPGRHNAFNALAALAACRALGVDLRAAARGLEGYRGVARRFEIIGSSRGVEVIDDYAHNPEKVAAVIETAKMRCRRLHAIFQPHGYIQTKWLRRDYAEAFHRTLGREDELHFLEVFYAGGTVTRDISSRDLLPDYDASKGPRARFWPAREDLIKALATESRPGDAVLLMGARDPGLGSFARRLFAAIEER